MNPLITVWIAQFCNSCIAIIRTFFKRPCSRAAGKKVSLVSEKKIQLCKICIASCNEKKSVSSFFSFSFYFREWFSCLCTPSRPPTIYYTIGFISLTNIHKERHEDSNANLLLKWSSDTVLLVSAREENEYHAWNSHMAFHSFQDDSFCFFVWLLSLASFQRCVISEPNQ